MAAQIVQKITIELVEMLLFETLFLENKKAVSRLVKLLLFVGI
ncbi:MULTISPECIES: hypothetical protein [unclassified Flavobacterium]